MPDTRCDDVWQVSHKLGDRNVSRLLSCSVLRLDVGKLIVRMTFHKAWLELVTPAEDIPPEPAPEADALHFCFC